MTHYKNSSSKLPSWFDLTLYEESGTISNQEWADLLRGRYFVHLAIEDGEPQMAAEMLEVIIESPLTPTVSIGTVTSSISTYGVVAFTKVLRGFWEKPRLKKTIKAMLKATTFAQKLSLHRKTPEDVLYKLNDTIQTSNEDNFSNNVILSANLNYSNSRLIKDFKEFVQREREARGVRKPKGVTAQTKSQQISNRWLPLLDLYYHRQVVDPSLKMDDIYLAAFRDFNDLQGHRKGKEQLINARKFIANPEAINSLGLI